MADARVPWVLPIRQGTEIFDGSKGRTPAVVRITIGVKPNTPREMMPYLQERAQQIIEARQSQLIAFYQVALQSHGLGIVPITARTLNLQELQARYQNQNGTEILDITIYPDLAFTPPKPKKDESIYWDYLVIDFRFVASMPDDWFWLLDTRTKFTRPTITPTPIATTNNGNVVVDPQPPDGWIGAAMGNIMVPPDKVGKLKSSPAHFKDVPEGAYTVDGGYMYVGPTLYVQDGATSNVQSVYVDLRRFTPGTALRIPCNAIWYSAGIDGDQPRGITIEYRLFKGGHMHVHPAALSDSLSGPGDRCGWQNYGAEDKRDKRQIGSAFVSTFVDTSDESQIVGEPIGTINWNGSTAKFT